MKLTRSAVVQLGTTALTLLSVPQAARPADLSDLVRRAVVRSAQIADQADSVWQQVAGEVVPAWQRTEAAQTAPPALIDAEFAASTLALPLEIAALCGTTTSTALLAQVPAARQDALLLYKEGTEVRPLQNEPLYGVLSKPPSEVPAGAAVRVFSPSLAAAAAVGEVSNSTVFGFEAYARWRVVQATLSDERLPPVDRKRLQQCFSEKLGDAMLQGPLKSAQLPAAAEGKGARSERSLERALDGCGKLLDLMQAKGLFTRYALQTTMGSGTDMFDTGDWQAGGSTGWQYIVSGSALVGGSQLAQDRTAATGRGAGLYPGQLLTAPLAAYLRQQNIAARVEEYFLDNRVGRPDPRTFSDPRYYSEVLLEVVALEEDTQATSR